jgi:hypothetical protein
MLGVHDQSNDWNWHLYDAGVRTTLGEKQADIVGALGSWRNILTSKVSLIVEPDLLN